MRITQCNAVPGATAPLACGRFQFINEFLLPHCHRENQVRRAVKVPTKTILFPVRSFALQTVNRGVDVPEEEPHSTKQRLTLFPFYLTSPELSSSPYRFRCRKDNTHASGCVTLTHTHTQTRVPVADDVKIFCRKIPTHHKQPTPLRRALGTLREMCVGR